MKLAGQFKLVGVYLTLLISLCSTIINAQHRSLEWIKSAGGANTEFPHSVTVDIWGNVYTAGFFTGTSDFDPGPATFNLTANGTDVFIQKLDANGNFIWAKSFGGFFEDRAHSITTDVFGNVYTTGYFFGTSDFDPGPGTFNMTTAGFTDAFIQKLDANGNFMWARSFGGASGDEGGSITTDAQGNVYLTGTFDDTVDFDPGPATFNLISNSVGLFILKLDNGGDFIWAKSMDIAAITEVGSRIMVDTKRNVYLTGIFSQTTDFDPGTAVFNLTAVGDIDVFIQKLDSLGNFIWAKSFGGQLGEVSLSIASDTSWNIYIAGAFKGSVDFDPGPGIFTLSAPTTSSNVFIQKLDPAGDFIWAKSFGSSGEGPFITTDSSGYVYVTGSYQGTVDFDPNAGIFNLTSNGLRDVFIQKLDLNGNFAWAKSIGGISWDDGNSITTDSWDNLYIVGAFQDTVDFDPDTGTINLVSQGNYDVFVMKLSQQDSSLPCPPLSLDYSINHVTSDSSNGGVKIDVFGGTPPYLYSLDSINFQMSSAFTALDTGTYLVYVVDNNGCVTQGSFTVNAITVGENKYFNSISLNIYPNPTTGTIYIDIEESILKEVDLTVKNLEGRTLLKNKYAPIDQICFKLDGPKGLYLVELNSQEFEPAVFKILKK